MDPLHTPYHIKGEMHVEGMWAYAIWENIGMLFGRMLVCYLGERWYAIWENVGDQYM